MNEMQVAAKLEKMMKTRIGLRRQAIAFVRSRRDRLEEMAKGKKTPDEWRLNDTLLRSEAAWACDKLRRGYFGTDAMSDAFPNAINSIFGMRDVLLNRHTPAAARIEACMGM
jgi:hypothetical protein